MPYYTRSPWPKSRVKNICIEEKFILWPTINPGLVLTTLRTTLPWGPFLQSPGNLTLPKWYFEIKVSRKVGCVLTTNEVHFVSLAENFTVQFSKLLKRKSSMSSKSEPTIWSRGTGPQIPCLERCQLNIAWMFNIKDTRCKPRLYDLVC